MMLKDRLDERAIMLANYIIENKATVRQAADWAGVPKTTVHLDVTKRLQEIDLDLYDQVKEVLDVNLAERHIRGGEATKRLTQEKRAKMGKK